MQQGLTVSMSVGHDSQISVMASEHGMAGARATKTSQ